MERLRTIRPWILDNSIRETTVVSLRGHVLADKQKIIAAVKKANISDFILGSFGLMERVDDVFCKDLQRQGLIEKDAHWTFSEIRQSISAEGLPSRDIPTGMQRAKAYGIANIIIEMDVGCVLTKMTDEEICLFLEDRVAWARAELGGKVLVNFRDALTAWKSPKYRKRMHVLMKHLSTMEKPLYGILYEDPDGDAFPSDHSKMVSYLRGMMTRHNWDGHLSVHIHKKAGQAYATILECLACGANGVWGAMCEEGAGTGHACSLIVLTNLAMLGNPHIEKDFNMPALYEGACSVHTITTGERVPYKQVVYGGGCLDVVFGAGGMGGDTAFSFGKFFQKQRPIRITTFTDPSMYKIALEQQFGPREYSFEVCKKMQEELQEDLVEGKKYSYQTKAGLLDLYQRSGGTDFLSEMMTIAADCKKDEISDDHRLLKELKVFFFEWDKTDIEDGKIGREAFFRGFLQQFIEHETNPLVQAAFNMIDADEDGIEWHELKFRAVWIIHQYPKESDNWTLQELIDRLVTTCLLPEAIEVQENRDATKQCN